MASHITEKLPLPPQDAAWPEIRYHYGSYIDRPHRPPTKTLILAVTLFLLTFCTCLAAGTQFAVAFRQNQAASFDEFLRALALLYQNPSALVAGLPFAFTLLTILLAHELGHFFACRYHHIRASYPFFIPFPSLIGTFGAFIRIRSPIRTTRALFDVGASGPFAGLLFAMPALVYGVLHAKIVYGLADTANADVVFGAPALLHLIAAVVRPGAPVANLLLHPVGRAAWVGLFATSLNLLPAGQLDGGHILRSISVRAHRVSSLIVPFFLLFLGWRFHATLWLIWAVLLLGIRFFRTPSVYDPLPLDRRRKFLAIAALIAFLFCFMPAPIVNL